MKANDKFNIDINPTEAPDFDMKMSEAEKTRLTQDVLAKIDAIQNQVKPGKHNVINFRRKAISLIAAAILLVASTTAIATITTQKYFNPEPVQLDESLYTHESEEVDSVAQKASGVEASDETIVEIPEPEQNFVKLNYSGLEGYTVVNNQDGWYNFEHSDSNLNFDCQVIYGDVEWSRDYVIEAGIQNCEEFIPEYQWINIDGKKALYAKYSEEWLYTQHLFIRYKYSKYTLSILVPKSINEQALLELGRKITLEETDESQGSAYVNLSDYLKKYCPDKMKGEAPRGKTVTTEQIKPMQEIIGFENCQVVVDSVDVYDNAVQFELSQQTTAESSEIQDNVQFTEEVFWRDSDLQKNLNLFNTSDGNSLTYKRKYVYKGDGINTPSEKIVTEKTQQKFYIVNLRVKNNSAEKIDNLSTLYPLEYICENEGEYFYDSSTYIRPTVIDKFQKENKPACFSRKDGTITLEPGQEAFVKLGYFADADLSEIMYISLGENKISLN